MQNMTPTQRMNEALVSKHVQKKQLADAIGVPATTLNSWINRGADFPASYIQPIAEFLHVHPLWPITGEEAVLPEIPDTYMELSEEELFLLRTFRSLDQEGRVVVANKAVEELRRVKLEQGSASSQGAASS